MKKGFTLIELLAVIVILAIIALIASPIIIGLIDDSKKEAFKDSGYGIIKVGEIYYSKNMLNGTREDIIFTYTNGVETSSIDGTKLDYNGTKPKSGEIKIKKDGKIAAAIYNGKYCIQKEYDDSEVILSEKVEAECIIPYDCGTDLVDARDNNVYPTVKIGSQCWLAENLRYTGNGCLSKSWNDSAPHDACTTRNYGGIQVLYQWMAAMNGDSSKPQGLCPSGWHIPSDAEWKIVEGTLDSTYKVGNAVWDNSSWRGNDVGTKLKEELFNGTLPGYSDRYHTLFGTNGSIGKWWTSTPLPDSVAANRTLDSSHTNVSRGGDLHSYGASVRCIFGPGL